ncbi:PRTRC system protein A [Sphingobium yanoikuyae]|uniref:PRTRC system protein A n=2 Tax=Sphingomonadaceae TaxID=41297 RepID=A0AA43B8U5_SPHYA|nr:MULTISPECIES: PRTRC system protein A [Sphingobium]MDH2129570.1 PRTRC system protein A [Sphingobium yanoikuyae]MDH2149001.1 PRTRC system protein A [Sphingobium yanoikuyae]MDH2167693.1 PRTRC system protein A [Sphingobium yanoikuyae]WIA54876.1 PRTRC system protein A [Sphingobium sp. WTD-1]
MTMPTDDATAAAVLEAMPCYPVPPFGRSPAIETLRASRVGHGLAIGSDGVMLILRRPWLALDVPVAAPIVGYVPYGSIGAARADLRCGLVPRRYFVQILKFLKAALPNEAAAFILWNEASREFAVEFPEIDEATPTRLVYRMPRLPPDWHMVCDIHSHAGGRAFFSATDDADDAHATKIAIVFGRLDHPDGPTMAARLCAGGMFLPLPRCPFAGTPDAD